MAESTAVSFELRVPADDDFIDFMRPVWRGFGYPEVDDAAVADERLQWERERSLGAVDGDEWVAGAGAFSFDLTVPGGATTPVAGVTMVGVASTHRRQGILSAMMDRQLDDVVERGEVAAILTASETMIYGRFGYGWAASAAHLEIESGRAGFRQPPTASGRLRMVSTDEAIGPLQQAYGLCARRRAGTVSRNEAWWKFYLGDPVRHREGNSALYVIVHEDDDGRPDGFATYRVKQRWPDSLPDSTVVVDDLVGIDAEVEATLWRYLLDVDLASSVSARVRPVDDPIRWRLVEPRRLKTRQVVDYLWVRVLDVAAALTLRTYGATDGLVLEVVDRFRPASGGRFRLDGSVEGARCAATDAPPDLVLGVEELGSIYLGGVAPSALAAAARIEERTTGALLRADALFFTTPAPFSGTMF